MYHQQDSRYAFPYGTIVQSAGFGKSRLIKELGELVAHDDNEDNDEEDRTVAMRVFYVSSRDGGFPCATPLLRNFLRGELSLQKMCDALCLVVEYAMAHWDTECVADWTHLLDDTAYDRSVVDALEAYGATIKTAVYATSMRDVETEATTKHCQDSSLPSRVVVVAVDDTREWFAAHDESEWTAFQLLHLAVRLANEALASKYNGSEGGRIGVFGLLVDSHPSIATLGVDEGRVFPPFIADHTPCVCAPDEGVWDRLVDLGRLLWRHLQLPQDELIVYAARKLLKDLDPNERASFCEHSMNGIAALLCRLDVTARYFAPLSKTLVADLMAYMLEITTSMDLSVRTRYSSDPVLTVGAAHVWYNEQFDPLAECLLPEFRKLVLYEDLRVAIRDVDNVLARIILLLAMDSCGSKTCNDRRNRGELVSVDAFLDHLVGDTSQVRTNKATSDGVDASVGEWSDWLMGFSHFCELREFPTQSLIKSLLAQRGVAVWNHGGDDGFFLFLPIAREDPMMHEDTDVSVIVIHMALIKEEDYPVSAKWIRSTLSQMEACDLVDLDPANVVYVSMRMRGSHDTLVHMARYVLKKKNKKNDSVLFLNGVSWWANPAVIPLIAPAVVEQLERFLEYDSNPMHTMKALLEFQKESHPFAQELRSMRLHNHRHNVELQQ